MPLVMSALWVEALLQSSSLDGTSVPKGVKLGTRKASTTSWGMVRIADRTVTTLNLKLG